MKKRYAYNKKGQKIFCKTDIAPSGVLVVDFYLPRNKFSILWKRTKFIQIQGIREVREGKKDIVTYLVHPIYWLGASFHEPTYLTQQDAVNMVFDDFIKLYV